MKLVYPLENFLSFFKLGIAAFETSRDFMRFDVAFTQYL